MPRRVLIEDSGRTIDLVEQPSPDELHLQEVLKANPQLIPTEDLGLEGELLVIGRETTLASGAIDLLCLARSGDVVLIEFKTGPQNPDFRAALSQALDYGSDLWRMPVADFDRAVVQRFFAGHRSTQGGITDLAGAAASFRLDDAEREAFDSRLEEVLTTGDFTYVIAAQRFTPAMAATLDYLNTTMRFGRFFLIELIRLGVAGDAQTVAHAAQVIAKPPRRAATTSGGTRQTTTESAFIEGLSDASDRAAMTTFFSTCAALGLVVQWRSKGVAIRLQTDDRERPYSIAWALPEGRGWVSAHDLTLGIERHQLATMATVRESVEAYVHDIQALPGGQRLEGYLDGAIIPFGKLEAAMPTIIEAISGLVQRIQSADNRSL